LEGFTTGQVCRVAAPFRDLLPNAHILSRAASAEPELKIDAVTDEIEARDVFLLCSDGPTCVVTDAEIAERLSGFAPEMAVRRLLDLALARGAPDNVTVVAICCEEITRLALAAQVTADA
jgi:serine/threonine protein phosphatase PrpC